MYQHIIDKHVLKYNERYAEHGDDNKALGWPSRIDSMTRFMVMFGVTDQCFLKSPVSLLDFGCGLGHFVGWLANHPIIEYTGLDINSTFVKACREKCPDKTFLNLNILHDSDFAQLPKFDFVIANGVFTERLDTPWREQWDYFTTVLKRLWQRTKYGLAFNVMSPVVDEMRDDLFHVPFDDTAQFVKENLSRKFTFRHDYGLWEYTIYVYR